MASEYSFSHAPTAHPSHISGISAVCQGHCVNEVIATTMYSLTLMLTDLLIYVMPMPIIWKLRMTTRRKIETILVFMVGLM